MYTTFKFVHLCAAIFSFSGFVLRGYWMLTDPPLLQRRWVRVLPHTIDTVFLLSGLGLFLTLRLELMQNEWLVTKLAALVVYIILGSIALRRGPSLRVRATAYVLGVLTFAYIVGVAITKSNLSWFASA